MTVIPESCICNTSAMMYECCSFGWLSNVWTRANTSLCGSCRVNKIHQLLLMLINAHDFT